MLYLAVVMLFVLVLGGAVYVISRKKLPDKWKCIYRKYSLFVYWIFGIVCVIMTLNCFLLYQVSPFPERFGLRESPDREYGAEELGELRDFVECVIWGRRPQSDFALARETVKVVYGAYCSAEEGRRFDF